MFYWEIMKCLCLYCAFRRLVRAYLLLEVYFDTISIIIQVCCRLSFPLYSVLRVKAEYICISVFFNFKY